MAKEFHFARSDRRFEIFTISRCESCEGFTRENSQTITVAGEPFLRSIGTTRLGFLPPESYYSDQEECEVCERCDPENSDEEDAPSKAKLNPSLLASIQMRFRALGFNDRDVKVLTLMMETLYERKS